jgi:uncharacterized protein DUF4279
VTCFRRLGQRLCRRDSFSPEGHSRTLGDLGVATLDRYAQYLGVPIWFVEDPDTFTPPPTRSSASLVVLSEELDSSQLATLVGLAADESWERGERPHAPGRFSGYRLRSELPESASPAGHLTELLRRLAPVALRVGALTRDSRVVVQIWLSHHIANFNPGLSLTADHIAALDSLGTGVEIDVYVEEEPGSPSDRGEP